MMQKRFVVLVALCMLFGGLLSCNSSDDLSAIGVAVNPPSPQPLDLSILGVNAFVNDSRFGTIQAQFTDVQSTLHIPHVRVLFEWNDGVQGAPGGAVDYSFYDSILNNLPSGMDVDVVLDGLPSWMSNSANWIKGDPRATFAQDWVQPVLSRYANNNQIVSFEIWNEPDDPSNNDNVTMGFVNNPANYVELLMLGHDIVKSANPNFLVLNAATTSIQQNFSTTLSYNQSMQAAGATSVVDKWNIHYYGAEYANVEQSGGVADFLNGLSMPVWVSESGAQGVNNQLNYAETTWPFLTSQIPSIERIYIYQYTEATDPSVTYGLRNLSATEPVSDLYIYLRSGGTSS